MPLREVTPLLGWGPFIFGMTFDAALIAYPGVVWDTKSSVRCREEMRLRGCTLSSAEGSRVPPTAGVALLPTVLFNQEGRLAAIRLGMFLRVDNKPAQCERAYARLLDYLHDDWGPPTASWSAKEEVTKRSSPQGRQFSLRTDSDGVAGRETFHLQPDGRKVVLLLRYVGATNPATALCHLSVYYRGPESLQPPPEERPHPLKNWH